MVMTPETCVTFFEACASGKNNFMVSPRDNNIRKMFNDFDSDNDGKMVLEDFLTFYRQAAKNATNTVWENLQAHEIGVDLHPDPKTDHDYKND